MSFTLSPSMNLPIPGVGSEAGPQYAFDINNALTIVDSHDHTNGSGVPITPQAININSPLSFQGNSATAVSLITFSPNAGTPAVGSLYEAGVDLVYRDGNGNIIKITDSGGIAGTPGSISNLVAPASATYVSGSQTFVFQSDTSVAANMDVGSVILRNLSPNSTFALTLSPPANLVSNYTLTLPALPTVSSVLVIDPSGAITPAATIPTANIADGAITTAKLATGSVTQAKIGYTAALPTIVVPITASGTFTVPANVTVITILGAGGGGGGGGGAGGGPGVTGGGGGAGGGAPLVTTLLPVTPGDVLTIVIGSGGGAGAVNGDGGTGGNTTVYNPNFPGVTAMITYPGAPGGRQGTVGSGGSGGGGIVQAYVVPAGGGGSNDGASGAAAGAGSQRSPGGRQGSVTGSSSHGGAGGGGGSSFRSGGDGGNGANGAIAQGTPGQGAQANSGAGGGGGGGGANTSTFLAAGGGDGGSGRIEIYYTPTT